MPGLSDVKAVTAIVTGLVQGVGFRYATRSAARRLGVAGWVRNRPDDTVEVFAQGTPEAVAQLVAFLHTGPPHAVVDRVEVTGANPDPHMLGFDLRY